jgi:hypothetical protein
MSLAGDIAEARGSQLNNNGCSACIWLENAKDGEEKDLVIAALKTPKGSTIGAERLAGIFRKNGIGIGRQSILAHRKDHQ